eukprot:5919802-Amphidinium_carterae.2
MAVKCICSNLIVARVPAPSNASYDAHSPQAKQCRTTTTLRRNRSLGQSTMKDAQPSSFISLCSSVAEHQTCNLKVRGSIPCAGFLQYWKSNVEDFTPTHL